jgi:hypothetical protein
MERRRKSWRTGQAAALAAVAAVGVLLSNSPTTPASSAVPFVTPGIMKTISDAATRVHVTTSDDVGGKGGQKCPPKKCVP